MTGRPSSRSISTASPLGREPWPPPSTPRRRALCRRQGQDAVCADLHLHRSGDVFRPQGDVPSVFSTRPWRRRLQSRPQPLSRFGDVQRTRRDGLGPDHASRGKRMLPTSCWASSWCSPDGNRQGVSQGTGGRLAATGASRCPGGPRRHGSRQCAGPAADRQHRQDCGQAERPSRCRPQRSIPTPKAAWRRCDLDQIYNVIGFNENSNDLTPKLTQRLDQIVADIGDRAMQGRWSPAIRARRARSRPTRCLRSSGRRTRCSYLAQHGVEFVTCHRHRRWRDRPVRPRLSRPTGGW